MTVSFQVFFLGFRKSKKDLFWGFSSVLARVMASMRSVSALERGTLTEKKTLLLHRRGTIVGLRSWPMI
jgi:hypothetical protein